MEIINKQFRYKRLFDTLFAIIYINTKAGLIHLRPAFHFFRIYINVGAV